MTSRSSAWMALRRCAIESTRCTPSPADDRSIASPRHRRMASITVSFHIGRALSMYALETKNVAVRPSRARIGKAIDSLSA